MKFLRPLATALLAAVLATPAIAGQGTPAPSASAVGYAALLPGGTQGAVSADSAGTTQGSSSAGGLRPPGGGNVGAVRVNVSAAASGTSGVAQGTVIVSDVTLLDGRVSLGTLRMAAVAAAGAARSGLTEGSVSGLRVDGAPIAAGPGSRVDVPGLGTLVFLEHVSDGAGGVRANGLRLEISDPGAASVIGEPFVLGHLDLSATEGTAPAAPAPARTVTTAPGSAATAPFPTAPATEPTPPVAPVTAPPALGLPRRAAPAVAIPTGAGYVFPVVGEVSFTDDYGAPRAGTGWHHGNDIFAERGTPLVAVADGTLSRVGVNTLGGNRLWLTDDAGNAYYYAHLSAYAPVAVEGARVNAGQVIGFVGNTGQAITTPPHLHFEAHPGGGDSVDPYPYLIAWQRGSDVPQVFAQAAATSPSPAPAAGAVLVDMLPELDSSTPAADGLATPAS